MPGSDKGEDRQPNVLQWTSIFNVMTAIQVLIVQTDEILILSQCSEHR